MLSLCSADEAVISAMMSDTRRTLLRISVMVCPAWLTRRDPSSTRSTDEPIRPLISLAASALREVAHLAGHNGKAPALFTCASSFHRRIQCQDVGLEGNGVDDAGDVGNLARAGRDLVHGGHHLGHHGTTACGHFGGR